MIDWQVERAEELSIITKAQITEEMQLKLEQFEQDCIYSEECARDSCSGTYSNMVLESEHKSVLESSNYEYEYKIKSLENEITNLKDNIRSQSYDIFSLNEQLQGR